MIRVGTAGWSYPDWEGIVYPRPKQRGFHALPFLAQFFDCVEVNSTFYAMPSAQHCESWLRRVEDRPGFRFLAKLHQGFTHAAARAEATHKSAVAEFRAGLAPLFSSGKFSALLLQFPAHFHASASNAERLERLTNDWPGVPLAIELRHRSWFAAPELERIAATGAALLHVDMPAAPDHPPQEFPPTSRLGYLRLHGRNSADWFKRGVGRDERYNYLYTPTELDHLAAKAGRLANEHDDVYVITNNHFAGQAVANALELQARLTGQLSSAPTSLIERYPRLSEVCRALGQGNLF